MHAVGRFALAIGLVSSCGIAHGVMLNPRGMGQALIYPYYTVNAGQDTLVCDQRR